MLTPPQQLPELLSAIKKCIDENEKEVTELDKAIGDGDHVFNLQRGLNALIQQQTELVNLDWSAALMKMGMTLMSTMGGASGSLLGSLFVTMAKQYGQTDTANAETMINAFEPGVESVKVRGKSDVGEKTMLDTLIPAVNSLKQDVAQQADLAQLLDNMKDAAYTGMKSTEQMVATKGRASFLGERAKGHIDAGARTSQLILFAIADYLKRKG